jgi:hypothetical protein
MGDIMTRKAKHDDEMRSHYDFSDGVRGKYAERYSEGASVVRERKSAVNHEITFVCWD